tara:strand:+ start:305 stop:469 length:165 start_codon:yes stop_codon:yes gene_type:complete
MASPKIGRKTRAGESRTVKHMSVDDLQKEIEMGNSPRDKGTCRKELQRRGLVID